MGRSRTLVGGRVPYYGVSRRVAKSEKSVKFVKSVKFGKRRRSQSEVGGVSLGVGSVTGLSGSGQTFIDFVSV